MSIFNFIFKSLWFFRKQHLAVLAGTIISTAVLTGALIIGDSVKDSLRNMVDVRLGKTRFALQTGDRFVRSELAIELGESLKVDAASVLMLNGIGINPDNKARINKVKVHGIDLNFSELFDITNVDIQDGEAVIGINVAQKLGLKKGDNFLVRVENVEVIPISAPFSQERNPSVALRLKVKEVLDNNSFSRFSLKNNQAIPYNIFVSQDFLQSKLDLEGKSNVVLFTQNDLQSLITEDLNKALENTWQLLDAELKINNLENGEIELLSNRIFIDKPISNAIEEIKIPNNSILTYLVNDIELKEKSTPYSFVSAISNSDLPKNEILINSWLANDLNANIGDTIKLTYFVIGPLRKLIEKRNNFIVADILTIQDPIFSKDLMPEFPGLADAGSCSEWDTGIPIDLDKIRDKDEEYWNLYKGTPKAIISIETGKELWENSFGNYTSLRFAANDISSAELENKILKTLKPSDLNLSIVPVYEEGLNAVTNSVDFGELFLSLSFFVIAAGILLTILIYALNTESRKVETGILAALGFDKKLIRRIRFLESVAIIVAGSIVGALLGILYNYGIVKALNSIWSGAVQTSILEVSVRYSTLLTGAFIGMLIALISIYIVTTRKLKKPLSELIRNTPILKSYKSGNRKYINLIIILSFILTLALIIISTIRSSEINPSMFLSAGGLFLVFCILTINQLLKNAKTNDAGSQLGFSNLAIKNAGRNRSRTLVTISLLALGTFSVMITGANRKSFSETQDAVTSGTGGYTYWIESVLPIVYDLNSATGKEKLGIDDENLMNADYLQFFKLNGDDASCLNLNQVEQPQILGVDVKVLNERKAFSFANLNKDIDPDQVWSELDKDYGNNVIPAIADQTVIIWGLKKKVGDTLLYNNEAGNLIKLVLVAGLNNSIFQGNILIAEKHFHRHFPSVGGSQLVLMDIEEVNEEESKQFFQRRLQDYGIEITSTSERLAAFYTVENTYLTVFMILGGLGMIIGTIGLGIVIIRNIMERKQEFALLIAVGFKNMDVYKLLLLENIFILISGMLIGFLAATIGILPSLLSPSFVIPGYFIFIISAGIFISGLISIWIPSRKAIKGNLIASLRNE